MKKWLGLLVVVVAIALGLKPAVAQASSPSFDDAIRGYEGGRAHAVPRYAGGLEHRIYFTCGHDVGGGVCPTTGANAWICQFAESPALMGSIAVATSCNGWRRASSSLSQMAVSKLLRPLVY